MKLYLDTSALLKRYVTEPGTEMADLIFDKAERGELVVSISLWNIGEALGVLDEKRRKGWLTEKEFEAALNIFAEELVKLIRLKALEVIPVLSSILVDAWSVLMTYHVYEADAIQITTCKRNKNDVFVSSDRDLVKMSNRAGLESFHLIEDAQRLRQTI